MESEKDTIKISKDYIAKFLSDVSKVRVAFILSAPRFAAGSIGEQAVSAAHNLVVAEANLAKLLKGDDK